jgi:hypothetical protein
MPGEKRPRATSPAPPVETATLMLCPACHEHFRAPPHECAPHRLSCEHNVCLACLDALAMSDKLGYPVCSKPAEPHVVNLGLAAFAEDVFQAAARQGCTAASVNASKNCLSSGTAGVAFPCSAHPAFPTDMVCLTDLRLVCGRCVLACGNRPVKHSIKALDEPELVADLRGLVSASVDTISPRSATLLASAEQARASSQAMCDSVAASCTRLSEEIDVLHAALDMRRTRVIGVAKAACAARVKALGAVIDQLEVSARQLSAGVALGKAALACGEAVKLLSAAECLRGMAALATPTVPHADVSLVFDYAAVHTAISGMARVQVCRSAYLGSALTLVLYILY